MSSKHPDSTILATNEYKPGALSRAVARCQVGQHTWGGKTTPEIGETTIQTCQICGRVRSVTRP